VVAARDAGGSTISIVSGLPKNVTASWSAPGLTSTGAIVWKLTLTASASAIASTSTLSLNAAFAGDNGSIYRSAGNLPLTVILGFTKRLLPKPVRPPVQIDPAGPE
jgi:hypothetical protein